MANGLLNLQTDLKSLRYGSETPYVTKNIGQAPGSQIGLQVQSRIDDTSRIAQMLASKPGFKYLANEALLNQETSDRSIAKARKDGKSIVGAVLKQVKYTAQLVGSTLAQVPVNGTGTHFLKGFNTNTYIHPAQGPDTTAFTRFFGAGGLEGAPLALEGKSIGEGNMVGNITTQLTPEKADNSKYSTYHDEDMVNTTYYNSKEKFVRKPLGMDYDGDTYTDKILDRATKNGPVKKETRTNLGDQGARNDSNKRQNVYWKTSDADPKKSLEIDNINFLDVFDSVNGSKPSGTKEGRDLIKFRFHVITPDTTRILYFRAFLDSFADNYSGQWNPIKYLGRAEDFQIYSGFQRKITLSFKIAAATREEMKPLYKKMVYLASATAPSYADSGQFMRGTIVKLTLGDYVYELPGVLNSCNFTWNTEYPWEIALTEPENLNRDTYQQELPMVLDCNIDFTPIHTFTPETGLKKYFTTGLDNGGEGDANGFFKDAPTLGGDPIKIAAQNKKENAEREAANKAQAERDAQIKKETDEANADANAELEFDRNSGSSATSKTGTFNIVPDYLSQPYGS